MWRFFKRLFFFLIFLCFLALGCAGGALYWMVAVDPGPEIELEYIEGILGRESPVYYKDGEVKVGVLFQDAHRQYLPYDKIPKPFVNAIIAAEDDQFFHHFGIDFFGIARAMIANFKAGRIIQGGSTITQQTAKNLFKRESRTYQAKLKELLWALRLEYHYSKEKILEFYINQFFVSGNGHGLGVAARYYFDKEVGELNLLENAFIAGSVKRPNYYNPFTKSSEEGALRARKRADERAAYVLRNMRDQQLISHDEFIEAIGQDIGFHRGRTSFSLNTIMDLVRDGLSAQQITQALDEHGISNPSTSGIRIFTTVDKELQDSTLATLRSELSRIEITLQGYDRKEIQREYGELDYSGDVQAVPGAFVFGRITSIESDNDDPVIRVDLGRKRPEGIIDKKGLVKALTALVKFVRHRWTSVQEGDLSLLLDQLQIGDKVYVSVQQAEENGTLRLHLERFPELQGGALVLQEGAIRTMIGGTENRFFNRAIDAKRLMGSTFKPFLFAAAMQLGWSPTDLLDNTRDVFVYQDIPYFPRPDHISPHNRVSMSWTGVNSENLAAIWLLYHLTDHLTPPRLREVAVHLNLAPKADGLTGRYGYFEQLIRDRYGIVVNRDVILQAAYDSAVRNLEADFLFEGRGAEHKKLKELPYGLHFDRYEEEIRLRLEEEEEELTEGERKELELRQSILARRYLALQPTLEALEQNKLFYEVETSPAGNLDPLALLDHESGNLRQIGLFWQDERGKVIFSLGAPQQGWSLIPEQTVRLILNELGHEKRDEFWKNIELEGYVSMYALQQVSSQMDKEFERLSAEKRYSMAVLNEVQDYRVLVGLQYLVHMGKELGINAQLEPVLSFPLGSNVISLLDAVRMYETLVTGSAFTYSQRTDEDSVFNESSLDGLAIIDRIESMTGEVIYSREVATKRIVDSHTSASVSDILHNTIKYGTGRYAGKYVRLRSNDPERKEILNKLNLPVPLLGKTGTANEFRNGAFIGYVPVLAHQESVMKISGGYSVGVYVGYDDNKSMKKRGTNITGAAGALPTWSNIAMTLVNMGNTADRVDLADLSFNGLPLQYPDLGQYFVPVSIGSGGKVIQGRGALRATSSPPKPAILAHGRVGSSTNFEPERFFRPYWKNN